MKHLRAISNKAFGELRGQEVTVNIQEKLDGFLLRLYYSEYAGTWRISTTSSGSINIRQKYSERVSSAAGTRFGLAMDNLLEELDSLRGRSFLGLLPRDFYAEVIFHKDLSLYENDPAPGFRLDRVTYDLALFGLDGESYAFGLHGAGPDYLTNGRLLCVTPEISTQYITVSEDAGKESILAAISVAVERHKILTSAFSTQPEGYVITLTGERSSFTAKLVDDTFLSRQRNPRLEEKL